VTNRFVFVLTLFLAVSMVVAAADVTGKWTAQVPGREGQTRQVNFNFKVDGDKLTGTMSGAQGQEIAISDGKVTGDSISFVVTMERGGNTMKQNYTGKVSGNEIQMKRESSQGQAREFVAKRAN
jgi:putative heme iron utilization protein